MQNFSNRQDGEENIFKKAANVFYGDEKKKEKEEKDLRNSLLYELKDKLTPGQKMYADVKELQGIKDGKGQNVRIAQTQQPVYDVGYNNFNNNPKKEDGIIYNNETNEFIYNNVKLKDKLPRPNEEWVVSAKFANTDNESENDNIVTANTQPKQENNKGNDYFSPEALKRAREFIGTGEDLRLEAYKPLKSDVWTIGYGHTKGVKPGDKITEEEAERLYEQDFKVHTAPLKDVKVPLNDNEKIALASFIYNVGTGAFKTSTLKKKLDAGDRVGAAKELERWNKQNGKVVQGLINRRNKEKKLFLEPFGE